MMMKNLALSVVAMAVAVACTTETEPTPQGNLGSEVAVTVNGAAIPQSVYRLYVYNSLNKTEDQLSEEEQQAAVDDLVDFKLLALKAEEQNLLSEPRIAAELELQRLRFMANAYVQRYLQQNPPTDAEVRKLYEENQDALARPEYKLRHLVLDEREQAMEIIEALRSGESFQSLAEQQTESAGALAATDLGWASADSLIEPTKSIVAALEVGGYTTEPVQSEFGYHVLLLEDKRIQPPPTMEAIRDDLVTAAGRLKFEEYIKSLRQDATVE